MVILILLDLGMCELLEVMVQVSDVGQRLFVIQAWLSYSPLRWAAEPESQARGGRASSRRAGKRGSAGGERICEGARRPACASRSPGNLQPIIRRCPRPRVLRTAAPPAPAPPPPPPPPSPFSRAPLPRGRAQAHTQTERRGETERGETERSERERGREQRLPGSLPPSHTATGDGRRATRWERRDHREQPRALTHTLTLGSFLPRHLLLLPPPPLTPSPPPSLCNKKKKKPFTGGDVQLIKGRLAASANSKAPQIKRDCCNSWRIMQRKTLPGNSPSVEMRPREE
ncbi:uncharacterized protein LOC129561710 [Moschus berezovskii]|uniref:uncharacterized protein LOC129561710 n=1 Tax=Moschus berezovskii TaxID=68408 RepID=UPI002444CC64|nr:uncharacterized protein LOC129561710 [Moschus berezovskii]